MKYYIQVHVKVGKIWKTIMIKNNIETYEEGNKMRQELRELNKDVDGFLVDLYVVKEKSELKQEGSNEKEQYTPF
ncbi:MAG: hypothetical protein IIZ93_09065 [Acidaminococcaceae bacterium]|nr:hypothetical protein [Acidaminococcaceae bacterium]